MNTLPPPKASAETNAPMDGALLSLEESRRLARALRSRSHAERELVRAALQGIYSDWIDQWALPSIAAGARAEIQVIDMVADSVFSDEQASKMTKVALFGERAVRPDLAVRPSDGWVMSEALGDEAWNAWQLSLTPLFEGSGRASVYPGRVDPWSGGLHLAIPWATGEWVLHLNAFQVDRLLGRRRVPPVPSPQPALTPSGLTPLHKAMGTHALAVRVELGSLSLTLGQLQSLSVGDIVTLDHPLDTPAAMYLVSPQDDDASGMPSAAPLCAAWLGQTSGQMAIELLPIS